MAHSALPDTEANVIRNLMERIDELENTVSSIKNYISEREDNNAIDDITQGKSQNLKDKEIIEFIGEVNGRKGKGNKTAQILKGNRIIRWCTILKQ